jgi:plasmid stabilization system protein ParE
MNRFAVETTPSAEADIIDSFIWGCGAWGVEEAENWANELRSLVLKNLSTFPRKYPVASTDDGSGREYRQMIVGRYRVLFHIDKQVVWVIHVRGPFVDPNSEVKKDMIE